MEKPEMEFNIVDNPSELKQTYYINNHMKTIEEILENEVFSTVDIYGDTAFNKEMTIEAMKIYAFEIAMQALQDAAKKYEGVHMRDSFGCTCDVPSAIKSTFIKL